MAALYVNAVSYRGLIAAAEFASRLGKRGDATRVAGTSRCPSLAAPISQQPSTGRRDCREHAAFFRSALYRSFFGAASIHLQPKSGRPAHRDDPDSCAPIPNIGTGRRTLDGIGSTVESAGVSGSLYVEYAEAADSGYR